jgi:hypothetical protein
MVMPRLPTSTYLCATALALLVGAGGLAASACGSENTKLMVTGLDPEKGDAAGRTTVRIKGNRFTAEGPRTAKVYFGGRPAEVTGFENDNTLVVVAPGGKPNEVVDVLIVFDPGGQLKIAGGFRFVEKNQAAPSVDDLNINKENKDKK